MRARVLVRAFPSSGISACFGRFVVTQWHSAHQPDGGRWSSGRPRGRGRRCPGRPQGPAWRGRTPRAPSSGIGSCTARSSAGTRGPAGAGRYRAANPRCGARVAHVWHSMCSEIHLRSSSGYSLRPSAPIRGMGFCSACCSRAPSACRIFRSRTSPRWTSASEPSGFAKARGPKTGSSSSRRAWGSCCKSVSAAGLMSRSLPSNRGTWLSVRRIQSIVRGAAHRAGVQRSGSRAAVGSSQAAPPIPAFARARRHT